MGESERTTAAQSAVQDVAPTLSLAFWDRKVGPFLSEAGVLDVAALSLEELRVCEEFGDILRLNTAGDRDVLYPTFQFGPRGELLAGLRDVVAALLPRVIDEWDIALWLTTVQRGFGAQSALSLMRGGRTDEVVASAQREGERLAGARGMVAHASR